ncbi:MAG: VOC family protein [Maribacter sp.]|nr:VOC family protein [Maribacter sp.]
MIFEHFALNVVHVDLVVSWYVDHLDLHVVSEQKDPPYMTFLADSSQRVFLELYHRPDEEHTDFSSQNPLTFHLAFVSTNAEFDKTRLVRQGATFVEEAKKADGSHLVMLRDPWGLPLQLCQRTRNF